MDIRCTSTSNLGFANSTSLNSELSLVSKYYWYKYPSNAQPSKFFASIDLTNFYQLKAIADSTSTFISSK